MISFLWTVNGRNKNLYYSRMKKNGILTDKTVCSIFLQKSLNLLRNAFSKSLLKVFHFKIFETFMTNIVKFANSCLRTVGGFYNDAKGQLILMSV